ncbi:MAG TPA: class I SAM-dependent methyltransferase [Nocardioides sp.]|nr:class I SAM-dependent methyltransferase [Nocardioides sp.]
MEQADTDFDAAFDAAWALASGIEGWLTRDQASVLFGAARSLPPASTVVEIGSHQGRSTVVLAAGLPPGSRLVAVDPFDPGWRYGAPSTRDRLLAHLDAAGVADRVEVVATTSRVARATHDGPVGLLYVDGKHDYRTVRDDLRWAGRVPDGGVVLVHDAFSSLGVTLALLRTLPLTRRLAYAGRTGTLARLDVRRPTRADRLRPARDLPWWGRNLAVKVLLRLHLRGVARVLGHQGAADPY